MTVETNIANHPAPAEISLPAEDGKHPETADMPFDNVSYNIAQATLALNAKVRKSLETL